MVSYRMSFQLRGRQAKGGNLITAEEEKIIVTLQSGDMGWGGGNLDWGGNFPECQPLHSIIMKPCKCVKVKGDYYNVSHISTFSYLF